MLFYVLHLLFATFLHIIKREAIYLDNYVPKDLSNRFALFFVYVRYEDESSYGLSSKH